MILYYHLIREEGGKGAEKEICAEKGGKRKEDKEEGKEKGEKRERNKHKRRVEKISKQVKEKCRKRK